MKLLVHIGIYKTGSSYLQYLCANNKEELQRQGIFFPSSIYDKEMKRGGVSPGNGHALSSALRKNDQHAILKLLNEWMQNAKKNNCHSILISSEYLVHDFANKDALLMFEQIVDKTEVERINVFAFLRDFVDHALSTYKHRAKSGNCKDFELWLEEEYETPQVLQNLVDNISISKMNWTLRKFEKSTNYLNKVFFNEWMSVSLPESLPKPKVNESLTLSEIALLKTLYNNYGLVIDYFIDALNKISKNKKAKDDVLEQEYKTIAYKPLMKYETLISDLNKFDLWENQHLRIGDDNNLSQPIKHQIALSSTQLEAVFRLCNKFQSIGGQLILLRRTVKKIMPIWILRNWSLLNRKFSI